MFFKLLLFGNGIEKVISSIILQKKDLRRIFHYAYKYKIATCTVDLPFYQSGNLKIATAISLYSIETLLLSIDSLGHK